MNNITIKLIDPILAKNACKLITATLPEWFGIKEANKRYQQGMLERTSFGAFFETDCIGLITLEFPYSNNANIYWMGVKKKFHDKGIGRLLLQIAENYCIDKGYSSITVETLSPKQKDKNYLKTYYFYEKYGFKPLFEMHTYDPDNLMLYMQKTINVNKFDFTDTLSPNTQTINRLQAREMDRRAIEDFGIPGIVLMENAGRSIAEFILQQNIKGKIVICCGKGNNGGDGFVIARHLNNHKKNIHMLLFAKPDEIKGDALINLNICLKCNISITIVDENNFKKIQKDILLNAECIVDALFGTGLEGKVKHPYDAIIQAINETSALILSVDIPSGLDCDTGTPLGIAIKAAHTFTVSFLKIGFIQPEAQAFLGKVHVIDIGIPNLIKERTY